MTVCPDHDTAKQLVTVLFMQFLDQAMTMLTTGICEDRCRCAPDQPEPIKCAHGFEVDAAKELAGVLARGVITLRLMYSNEPSLQQEN